LTASLKICYGRYSCYGGACFYLHIFAKKARRSRDRIKLASSPSYSRRKTGLRVGLVSSFEAKRERTKIIEEYEL
jgi:hypothetical protein